MIINDLIIDKGLSDNSLERFIKFVIFVCLTPVGLICNLIVIYYLIMYRTLRHGLHNHGVLAMLIATLLTNLIEVPRIINYLHIGIVIPQNKTNCFIWQWCDYSLFSLVNLLMLWISIERYLMIFHNNLYRTMNHRLLYHYLPLMIIPIYILIFYVVFILMYSCEEEQYDYRQPVCGFPCYTMNAKISLYDLIVHTWIPLFGGIFLGIIFLIRVIYRKRVDLQTVSRHQHRHRKMVIQVLSLSSIYSLFQSPFAGVLFIQLFVVLPESIVHIQTFYFYYLFWILTLVLPFVSIGCFPEIFTKMKYRFIQRIRPNVIVVPMGTIQSQNRTV